MKKKVSFLLIATLILIVFILAGCREVPHEPSTYERSSQANE